MDWLDRELAFIKWLYKYKNFLGKLKKREFKSFASKEEAIKTYEKETGERYE